MPAPWPIDRITWPPLSQSAARRNALHEALVCAERRREREEVDRFLAQREPEASGS
ncbi:MAG: hypothetical protein ACXVXC_09955 [Nocardioidaceae bacterium]